MTTFPANQNVYQRITDQVIAALDAGALTFTMPWHKGHPRPAEAGNRGESLRWPDRPAHPTPHGGPGQDHGNVERGTRHHHQSERENPTKPSR